MIALEQQETELEDEHAEIKSHPESAMRDISESVSVRKMLKLH